MATDTPLGVAVVAVTPDRSLAEDRSGEVVVEAFEAAGHDLATRELIRNDHDNVQATVSRLVDRDDVDLIVTTGGAGIEPGDTTLEAVDPLVDKDLPAFTDVFYRLSYEELGTGAVCRRALGGVSEGVPVFCLPGGEDPVRLAVEELLVPEARRFVAKASGPGEE